MKKIVIFILIFTFLIGIKNVRGAMFYEENLNSAAVYLVNKDTGISLIEKNINERRSPASITKIMTFIIVRESCSDINNTKVRVSQSVLDLVDPDSSGCKLKDGEEFTVLDLLHCMMICSSGDAAMVLADFAGGGIENFVNKMNEKAESLECEDTHFENPDGFYNENQYSTAKDIYKMTLCALDDPVFNDITNKSEYSLFGDERDPIITTNRMIDRKRGGNYYLPYVRGIKTGYLDKAGRCLVSSAVKNDRYYICVVLGAPTTDSLGQEVEGNLAMEDTKNIYTWVFEKIKSKKLYLKNHPMKEINLSLVWKKDKLFLSTSSDFYADVPVDAGEEDITIEYNVPKFVDAPVKSGEVIGTADVFYKNQKIGSMNLSSSENFQKNIFLLFTRFCKNVFSSAIFLILFFGFWILISAYVFLTIKKNRRRKKRNKVKRFPRIKK